MLRAGFYDYLHPPAIIKAAGACTAALLFLIEYNKLQMNPQILSETPDYFVIDKPAGMASEPPSHQTTLRDWLIENGHVKTGDWDDKDRFGIVHRLDTDTSGVIIWAKNKASQERLRLEWQGRQVKKTYLALAIGERNKKGEIELSIERDNKKDKMRVAMLPTGRERTAITSYETLAVGEVSGQKVSLVEAHPITGRTHQIRVHFKAIGHPLVGDKLYGEKKTDEIAKAVGLSRQFLHSSKIIIENKEYQSIMPEDLKQVLGRLNMKLPTL